MRQELYNFSKNYQEIIAKAVDGDPTSYEVSIRLSVSNGTVFDIPQEDVANLIIRQHTLKNYEDYITADVLLTETQTLILRALRQNMRAKIIIKRKYGGEADPNLEIFNKEMIAMLPHEEDVNTVYAINKSFLNSMDNSKEENLLLTRLEFEPERQYHLRKEKFNMILHDVTMEETIMAIAELLKFKTIYMVKPDNTTVYRNMIIPALTSIRDVFTFLQNSSLYGGVYASGINHYIMNEVLYVYPLFESIENAKVNVNFYNVGEGSYMGSGRYCNVTNDTISIVINSKITEASLTQSSIENVGTYFVTASPSKYIDKHYKLDGDIVTINDDNLEIVAAQTDRLGVMTDSFNQSYQIGNNKSIMMQQLYANTLKTLKFQWRYAMPYVIHPHMQIGFIKNSNTEIYKFPCVIGSMVFVFTKANTAAKSDFTCNAEIELVGHQF